MNKLTFFFVFMIASHFAYAQHEKQVQQLDSILSMMSRQNQFCGTILIAEKGRVIFEKGYGYRDENFKQKNNVKTVYELASCSKQFTAAAIVLLKRQGKLSYTDEMSKYLPELSFWKKVTIYDLIRHTSGIPEYLSDLPGNVDTTKIATNKDLIKFYETKRDTLKFDPGSRHRYSNTNYALLADIIERVSGTSYAKFLNDNVFKPLKMKHTFVYNRRLEPKRVKNYATGYVWANDSFDKVTSEDPRYGENMVYYLDGIVGNAKVNSTVGDIHIWIESLKANKLFTKEEFDLMTDVTKTNSGRNIPYGFGLDLSKADNKFSFGHTGSWDGYATFIHHNVMKDRTIITLQNFKMGAYPFANINQILDEKPLTIEYKKKINLRESDLHKFIGTYIDENNKDEIQYITSLNGHLVHNSKQVAWGMRFFPISSNQFQAVRQGGADGVLKFTTLQNGDIKLEMLQNGKVVGTGIRKT
jgi:CubicO group peptidase (beta-lactamase class C family)